MWQNKNIGESLNVLNRQKGICDKSKDGWRPTGRSAENQLLVHEKSKNDRKKQSLENAIQKEMNEMQNLLQELEEARRSVIAIQTHRNELWSDINNIVDEYDKNFDAACDHKLNAWK